MRVENGRGDAGAEAGFAKDGRVSISSERNAFKRDFATEDKADGVNEGVEMNAVAAAQERAVDVEEVCVVGVPEESGL